MSAFDRFRAPGSDLAAFFRSLATPLRSYSSSTPSTSLPDSYDQEWDHLHLTRGKGSSHLEFFGGGLRGTAGAEAVLRALEQNPACSSITLSHNELGDGGLLALLTGLKRLRAKGVASHLKELNLSGNRLTDVSLHLIALHLLQPSPHPTTLTHLILSNNHFTLTQPEIVSFLATSLASPLSSLQHLTLTNNRQLSTQALVSLLSQLKLVPGSPLSQLHLSVCGLTPEIVEPLTRWLEDAEGGGARLLVLGLNGNRLGEVSVRRIARAVESGKASGILSLEAHANRESNQEEEERADDDEDDVALLFPTPSKSKRDEWKKIWEQMANDETEEQRIGWEARLEEAKRRNKIVFRETRLAALGLLAKARVLFDASTREREADCAGIRNSVEASEGGHGGALRVVDQPFPFLRLPIELRVHVLRCCLLLNPSSHAHLFPPLNPPTDHNYPKSTPAQPTIAPKLSSPLTERQFLLVLAHCATRQSLAAEIRLDKAKGRGLSLEDDGRNRQKGVWGVDRREQSDSSIEEGPDAAKGGADWEEWVLRATECDRFARAGP